MLEAKVKVKVVDGRKVRARISTKPKILIPANVRVLRQKVGLHHLYCGER
jgi:hypothetical protein